MLLAKIAHSPAVAEEVFFNTAVTVLRLIFSTLAVSLIPLPFTAISVRALFNFRQVSLIGIFLDKCAATTFLIPTQVTLLLLCRFPMSDYVNATTISAVNWL